MRSATAPEGFHTEVAVNIWLANGTEWYGSWDTPMSMQQALHKATRWAKDGMREEKIRGRTQIVKMRIGVMYEKGAYKDTEDARGPQS